MKIIKEANAVGEWVVLRAIQSEKDEVIEEDGIAELNEGEASGTRMNNPDASGKTVVKLVVNSIGELVPSDAAFKIGDEVIVNDYDLQAFGDDAHNLYGVVHYKNIKVVVTNE